MKQNDPLKRILRNNPVPERSPEYWRSFPGRVTARLRNVESEPVETRRHSLHWAAAAACLLIVAAWICWRFQPHDKHDIDYAKLAREIALEFPGQLKAIVVDERGLRVELTDKPTVPVSTPLLIEVYKPQSCQRIITFSGQQITVNGEPWDVLVDGRGRVIVAGSSTDKYRIATRELEPM